MAITSVSSLLKRYAINFIDLRLVEGLTGESSTVSFESTSRPGYYLCRAGNKMIIVRMNSNNNQMKKDCTFRAWGDKFFDGYTSFEVAEEPDLWVRQSNRQLQVSSINTYRQRILFLMLHCYLQGDNLKMGHSKMNVTHQLRV